MKRQKNRLGKERLAISIILLAVFWGCAANVAVKPWADQSYHERLLWMTGIYNAQDRDYRSMAALVPLTESQKTVLQKKKAVMSQVYPLINAYRITVEGGGVPDQNTEQMILNLLNQIQTAGD